MAKECKTAAPKKQWAPIDMTDIPTPKRTPTVAEVRAAEKARAAEPTLRDLRRAQRLRRNTAEYREAKRQLYNETQIAVEKLWSDYHNALKNL